MKKLLFILSLGLLVPLAQADAFKCCNSYPIKVEFIKSSESCFYTKIGWNGGTARCSSYAADRQCSDGEYKVVKKDKCPATLKKIDDNTYEINNCRSQASSPT